MQKILVIQTAFIGDVVLATALIEKLHLRFPDAGIDFLLRKGNEGLFAGHPFLHEVLIWNKMERKFRHLRSMIRTVRQAKYDLVINVQRFAATGLLTALSRAGKTIGFDKNPFSSLFTHRIRHTVGGVHEVDRNQMLIRSLTDEVAARPRLYPTPDDEEKVREYKARPYLTISPASVWFTKQYPAEKWRAFLRELPENFPVFLLGAANDKSLCEEISAGNPAVVDLSGMLSFLQSAALMKDARMNYVNDSAPMHFATAVNAPVTAIYCSTIPGFGFGPLSDERYIVEIRESLDCRPCGLHGYKACPRGHFKCAWKIEETQLLQTFINSRPQ